MTKPLKIAVDVDMTVCDIDKEWLRWLNSIHNQSFDFDYMKNHSGGFIDYDLGVYYSHFKKPYPNYNSLDFFRKNGIYDCAKASLGAYVTLMDLHSQGHSIIFVSACKGGHMKSKYYWLKRKFPFMSAFVSTKEKWAVDADILFDDRLDYINPWINQTGKPVVFMKTDYRQSQPNFFDLKQASWVEMIDNDQYLMLKLKEAEERKDNNRNEN